MKRLAIQTGGAVLVGLLASCGIGYAAAGTNATTGLRDVSIIILAIFSLVGSLILAAVSFGGAWALGRFGPKAVTGVQKVGKYVGKAEDVTQSVVEKATVRPVARVARMLTSGATFVRSALGDTAPR
jgi:hypothetical protein